jgi:integrase/recombinase XerD
MEPARRLTSKRLLEVRRAHLEIFGRTMEADGRMRSTVARRLSTVGSFYRYCHVEGILERNPAANVRRPKVETESRTLGLDRNELGGLLVQAGLGSARERHHPTRPTHQDLAA